MLGRPRYFTDAEKADVLAAVRRAEFGTSGEVRVHVEARCKGDALDRARALFGSMCMGDTRGDTGVLLYVAARSHKAAVWAGAGVHGAGDEKFWQSVIDRVTAAYRQGAGATGVVAAIDQIGDLLRAHMPGEDTAGNELPDQVSTS